MTCSIPGCDKDVKTAKGGGRGMCAMHYMRWYRHGDPLANNHARKYALDETCLIDGCGGAIVARGWCKSHYQRWRRTGDPEDHRVMMPPRLCVMEGCDRVAISHATSLCETHYRRRKRGLPMDAPIGSLGNRRAYARNAERTCQHCGDYAYAKSLCRRCYAKHRRGTLLAREGGTAHAPRGSSRDHHESAQHAERDEPAQATPTRHAARTPRVS